MSDIDFRSAKLAPLKLDIQASTNKTLAEILKELQIGSVIKGVVTEITKDNHAIFTTTYGKFVIDNKADLKRGDRVSISITYFDKQQLTGKLISINNHENIDSPEVDMALAHIVRQHSNIEQAHSSSPVSIQKPLNVPSSVQAVVTYANLSHVNKDSSLYNTLQNLKTGDTIGCKIIYNPSLETSLYHQVVGTVINNDNPSKQLIKTVFGILSINAPTVLLPIGKKLNIAIESVNDKPLEIEHTPLLSKVEDFLFKLNNNLPTLQQLIKTLTNLSTATSLHNQSIDHHNNMGAKEIDIADHVNAQQFNLDHNYNFKKITIDAQFPDHLLYNDLSANNLPLSDLNEIRELFAIINNNNAVKEISAEVEKIKSTLTTAVELSNDKLGWVVLYLPIINDEETKKHEIFIKRTGDQLIRFVISINTEHTGELQLDGLVQLAINKNPKIEKFDLVVRFKGSMNNQLQEDIGQIFLWGREFSGISGDLNFEPVEEFESL